MNLRFWKTTGKLVNFLKLFFKQSFKLVRKQMKSSDQKNQEVLIQREKQVLDLGPAPNASIDP